MFNLTVSSAGVVDYSPDTARITVVVPGHTPASDPDGTTGPTSATCSQMHFFAHPESAASWTAHHPGVEILTIEEAERVARVLAANGL